MNCCPNPNIKTMTDRAIINRMCLTCGVHWYGQPDDLMRYSRKEWDAWMNTAFDKEKL
jgi:hypothetical protein